LTSIRILLQECGWETLEERRNKHKILLFHKMVNTTVPEYLSNLVPSTFRQTHQYSTRNHSNIVHVHSRTVYYNNSFLTATFDSGTNFQRISKVMFQSIPWNYFWTTQYILSHLTSMQVLELVKYYILEFELRVVRSMIIFIRKISKQIPTVVVNW
jgi:hypothetical protein